MDSRKASEMISENLAAIYGFAHSRLFDKTKSEDLASEIVCEILRSASNLKNEDAFWGFAWRIAENTFRKFIRREDIIKQTELFSENNETRIYMISPETEFIEREDESERIYLLRRELSLLSKTHREVCVAYYVNNKSCSEIAVELKISIEMVKQHLFKMRKILKEGISMTRALGKKSYNPGTFRMDFWGDSNKYYSLFNRKLPCTVVLAAYDKPMSANDLAIELGVSMPYLEDEIEILESAGILVKNGSKYQTNIVIITDEYEKAFVAKTSGIYKTIADDVFTKAKAVLPQIRSLEFHGNDYDDNRLLFAVLNIAFMNGYIKAKQSSPLSPTPKLPLGCSGWVFGYDNDYANHHFHGITMETWNKDKTAWFSAENYKAMESCQLFQHYKFQDRTEAMCDAMLGNEVNAEYETLPSLIESGFIISNGNRLSANFPVFTKDIFNELLNILSPIADKIAECMLDISGKAEKMLALTVPAQLKAQCGDIAKIHHRLDVAAFIMEELINSGKLFLPTEKVPLCVWGVK